MFTDEATPRPVRRASVLLASGELKFPQTVVTDDAGRFVFANLAAGNYSLVATKPGYVSATYGSKRPGRGQGVPIAVLDGQRVTDISLKMLHGGVITGTVRSVTGQPVPNLGVQVYQVDSFGGARHLSMAAPGNVATDDRGIYRAFGLAPGDYVVQITVSPLSSGMFGGDSRLVTPAEVQWAGQSGAPGAPGMTGVAALGPAPAPGQTVAYASLYFPGTADTNAASVITLGPEETRTGIDLTMAFVPTARIAGSVLDQDGRPMPGAQISLTPAGSSSDFARFIEGMARSMSRTGADGSFTITGVTPGQYAINARAAARDASGRSQGPGAGTLISVAGLMGMPGSASFWASADLSVNGVDIPDVVLRLQPGMNVSGKIVFEGSSAPPADVTKTRVSLTPPPTGSSQIELVASMMLGGTLATVSADGTFVVKGVAPNRYRVTVTGQGVLMGQQLPGSTWTLKSAMFNGRDVSDLAVRSETQRRRGRNDGHLHRSPDGDLRIGRRPRGPSGAGVPDRRVFHRPRVLDGRDRAASSRCGRRATASTSCRACRRASTTCARSPTSIKASCTTRPRSTRSPPARSRSRWPTARRRCRT